ncbi:hypothetical protein GCM10023183_00160 [Nibribacter koreensis]|uniref:Uncharacterized protein n=1 Tax=Nibribacter koreensis TaxID=1084519 RepID=A0ABP8F4Z3_9BACT
MITMLVKMSNEYSIVNPLAKLSLVVSDISENSGLSISILKGPYITPLNRIIQSPIAIKTKRK